MADTNTAMEKAKPPTLVDLVKQSQAELHRLLPDYDRFARILTTELRRTPKLADCTPDSFLGAAFLCAQLDLEPGPLGEVYLIPRKNRHRGNKLECTFLIGYRGIEKLALRSGQILSIETRTVYEGDEFHVEYFPEQQVIHRPAFRDGAEPVLWYAVARRADGSQLVHVLNRAQVEERRACSSTPDRGPWVDHYDAMARKSTVRAMWQNLPLDARDPQVDRALEVEDTTPDRAVLRPVDEGRQVDTDTGEIQDAEVVDDDADDGGGGSTPQQHRAVVALARQAGLLTDGDDRRWMAELRDRYDTDDLADLTEVQAAELIGWLQTQVDDQAAG